MEEYRGYTFRSEREILVSIFEKARSEAMNNYCIGPACSDGMPHGVHIDAIAHEYTIFQGSSYSASAPENEVIAGNPSVSLSGFTDVLFDQLTGKINPQLAHATDEITLTITQNDRTSDIKINNEGRINW